MTKKITKNTKIFCDMDGVLVDLYNHLALTINSLYDDPKTHKKLRQKIEKAYRSVGKQQLDRENFTLHFDESKNNRYIRSLVFEIISKNKSLWINLPWTKDGKMLWEFLSQFDPYILSAPVDKDCIEGKIEWIKNNISIPNNKIIITKQKYLFAVNKDNSPNVLIDDFSRYIIPWKKSGGIAVHHKSTNQTIKQLEKIIKSSI